MKKIKAKKNKKVTITNKNGKVIFDKKLDRDYLIETNQEVIVT